THGNLEHLIVDDGSCDGTRDVVAAYTKWDQRVRLLDNRFEAGAAGARNSAIMEARGRYIAFLDCDDFWHPNKLSAQLSRMELTRTPLTYSAYELVREDGTPTGRWKWAPETVTYPQLLRWNAIGCSTAMYDTWLAGR